MILFINYCLISGQPEWLFESRLRAVCYGLCHVFDDIKSGLESLVSVRMFLMEIDHITHASINKKIHLIKFHKEKGKENLAGKLFYNAL